MDASFFDLTNNWNKIKINTQNPKFREALNIYHWWTGREGKDLLPLCKEALSPDQKFIVQQNKEPYIYCDPHECIDLNPIVMGTLLSIIKDIDFSKLYVLSILPNGNSWDHHIIITDTNVKEGTTLYLKDEGNIILYDLIYPLMSWKGKSWNNRNEDLTILGVTSSITLKDYWIQMNYISYYSRS